MNTEQFISKYDNSLDEFTEDELRSIPWEGIEGAEFIETKEGEDHRWQREMTEFFKIGDRYFAIPWMAGLTEYQENEFYEQPYEVKPTEKIIKVIEWEVVE